MNIANNGPRFVSVFINVKKKGKSPFYYHSHLYPQCSAAHICKPQTFISISDDMLHPLMKADSGSLITDPTCNKAHFPLAQ